MYIFNAIRDNEFEYFKQQLKLDPKLWKVKNESENNVFIETIIQNKVEIFEWILRERGSEFINECGSNGMSPASFAVYFHRNEMVTKLLNHPNQDIESVDVNGCTAISYAVREQNYFAIEQLLEKNAALNSLSSDGYSSVFLTIFLKDIKLLKTSEVDSLNFGKISRTIYNDLRECIDAPTSAQIILLLFGYFKKNISFKKRIIYPFNEFFNDETLLELSKINKLQSMIAHLESEFKKFSEKSCLKHAAINDLIQLNCFDLFQKWIIQNESLIISNQINILQRIFLYKRIQMLGFIINHFPDKIQQLFDIKTKHGNTILHFACVGVDYNECEEIFNEIDFQPFEGSFNSITDLHNEMCLNAAARYLAPQIYCQNHSGHTPFDYAILSKNSKAITRLVRWGYRVTPEEMNQLELTFNKADMDVLNVETIVFLEKGPKEKIFLFINNIDYWDERLSREETGQDEITMRMEMEKNGYSFYYIENLRGEEMIMIIREFILKVTHPDLKKVALMIGSRGDETSVLGIDNVHILKTDIYACFDYMKSEDLLSNPIVIFNYKSDKL